MQPVLPTQIEEILEGDQVVGLAYVTPARGVVINPVTNFALRDRDGDRIAFNSSIAMWQKLERIRQNPRVALAFHSREYGTSRAPEYVLVQGEAAVPSFDDPYAWVDEMGGRWESFGGLPPKGGGLWGWWLRFYHQRVSVWVAIRRVVAWPDPACREEPAVYGEPLPAEPPASQSPPKGGTGPRIDQARAARRWSRLPHALLGWVGADGFPMVIPVEAGEVGERGVALTAPGGLVPPGGRRAGLAAHAFTEYAKGQDQLKHTGWLEVDGGRVVYAPHTKRGYRIPGDSLAIFRFAAGYGTRRGMRQGRRAGVFRRG